MAFMNLDMLDSKNLDDASRCIYLECPDDGNTHNPRNHGNIEMEGHRTQSLHSVLLQCLHLEAYRKAALPQSKQTVLHTVRSYIGPAFTPSDPCCPPPLEGLSEAES